MFCCGVDRWHMGPFKNSDLSDHQPPTQVEGLIARERRDREIESTRANTKPGAQDCRADHHGPNCLVSTHLNARNSTLR